MTTFKERLEEARTNAGLSIPQLAEKAGVSYQSLWYWETKGKLPRDKETLAKIARALGLSEVWLSSGVGEKMEADRIKKHEEFVKARKEKEDEVIIYRAADKRRLQDIELLISHLRSLDVSLDEKRAIHLTLSEIRADLENKVLFGERR